MPERAKEVLRYFLLHPDRADDLESVARWRLLEETIHRNVEEISQALGWLVGEGFLLEEHAGGSRTLFRLNDKSMVAAQRFLTRSKRRHKPEASGTGG